MKKYAMVVDSSVCIDCKACMVSCKVQNRVPAGHWRNWIKRTIPEFSLGKLTRTHFQPGGCIQCDNPTCVTACPSGATFKDPETGIVQVNESLCIGCGNCIRACPYGARFRHPEKRVPDKCDFCFSAGRLAQDIPPACVDTCPGALCQAPPPRCTVFCSMTHLHSWWMSGSPMNSTRAACPGP